MKDDKKFDNRLIDRHIEKGLFTEQEYQEHLNALHDCTDKSSKCTPVQPIAAKPESPAED